jgi:hypothetical protein
MDRAVCHFTSDYVNAEIDNLLLSGKALTVHDAESQFLDAHLDEIVALASSLSDEEFSNHEAVKLLMSHGSRPWEDYVK